MTKTISLIIPTYRPTEGWEIVFLDRYRKFCLAIGKNIPLVLVNDGSPNDISLAINYLSGELENNFHYVSYAENKGKGRALKVGASSIDTELYMFTDVDFPYGTESMVKVYESICSTPGIVTGYRQQAYYTDLSVFRTILSKGLRGLNKFLLALPVNDTQCGLKAFDHEVKELLLICETDRFLIDLELLLLVNQQKCRITPVLVNLRADIDFAKFDSTVLLKEVFSFLKLILRYRILGT